MCYQVCSHRYLANVDRYGRTYFRKSLHRSYKPPRFPLVAPLQLCIVWPLSPVILMIIPLVYYCCHTFFLVCFCYARMLLFCSCARLLVCSSACLLVCLSARLLVYPSLPPPPPPPLLPPLPAPQGPWSFMTIAIGAKSTGQPVQGFSRCTYLHVAVPYYLKI